MARGNADVQAIHSVDLYTEPECSGRARPIHIATTSGIRGDIGKNRTPPPENSPINSIARDHGRLAYTGLTVRGLIREAYGLKVYPLALGSDALATDRYDVIAKVPP